MERRFIFLIGCIATLAVFLFYLFSQGFLGAFNSVGFLLIITIICFIAFLFDN